MRRWILAPAALALLLTACGTADEAPAPAPAPAPDAAPAPASATVGTVDGDLGTFLVDGDGRTLYLFTVDEPGVSNCDPTCLQAWPPLLTDGAPAVRGAADAALVGTLTRDDGSLQVTYAGWPLYYFAADASAGDTNGQGVNDVWFVVAPDGTMITDEEQEASGDPMGGGGMYTPRPPGGADDY